MLSDDFKDRLAAAAARMQYGNEELSAAADDRARAIADEVERRGRGGARQVAQELGVSETTISQAVARARRALSPGRRLPANTLERLLAIELETVPPLAAPQWQTLAALVRSTFIDDSWIEQPGSLLAGEVEDAELNGDLDPAALADACREWSRDQALAIIDACQRDDLAALPTKDSLGQGSAAALGGARTGLEVL